MIPSRPGGGPRSRTAAAIRLGVWALVVSLSAGCAAHRAPALADRFVQRGGDEADEATFDAPGGAVPRQAPAAPAREPLPITFTSSGTAVQVEQTNLPVRLALAALRVWPTSDAHRRAGDAYRRIQILDRAYAHYRQAVAIDPRDAWSYDGLARTWRDWGFPDIALGDAYRAVAIAPASSDVQNTLGTVLYALGELDEAERRFERARTLDPRAAVASSNLCYLAYLRGESDRAREACTVATQLAPDLVAAHNNLALVHASEGRLDLASQAITRGNRPADRRFNLGLLLLARADYAAAASEFAASCAAEPRQDDACRMAVRARGLLAAPTDGIDR